MPCNNYLEDHEMPSHTASERKKKRQAIVHKKHGHFHDGLNPRLVEERKTSPKPKKKPKRRTK